ncbi:hypothetical protein PAXRUDRAFT_168112, partial [Paxillus rubicundulus Ve08.2h10]
FWSQSDYKKWEKGPEAQATITTHGPLPYLEDYPEATITAMMKKMRAIWQGFKCCMLAPKTWGSTLDFVRDSFNLEVVRGFPQMGLCDNFWKVDAVATARYSLWTQMHLKESNKRKVNTKSEPPEELGSPEPNTKKIKVNSDSSISPSTSPMDLDTSGPSSSLHDFSESSTASTTSPPCTSPLIFKNTIILPASDNVPTVETVASASDMGSVTIPEVKNPL